MHLLYLQDYNAPTYSHRHWYSLHILHIACWGGPLYWGMPLLTSYLMLNTWVQKKSLHLLTFSVRLHGYIHNCLGQAWFWKVSLQVAPATRSAVDTCSDYGNCPQEDSCTDALCSSYNNCTCAETHLGGQHYSLQLYCCRYNRICMLMMSWKLSQSALEQR